MTGFFGDMKDKIVGNSIVPDMVRDVISEFKRMGTGMRTEAVLGAEGAVTGMAGKLSGDDGFPFGRLANQAYGGAQHGACRRAAARVVRPGPHRRDQ